MGKTQQEIDLLFRKYAGLVKTLHLDVADGKFVPNTSLWFNFKLPRTFTYNAHLMIKNPGLWVSRYGKRMDSIIFHPECVKNIEGLVAKIKSKGAKVGLALKPETKVSTIAQYLNDIDYVLILTVHPGFYGARYLKSPLKKIAQVKRINPKIKVFVDGHMTPSTITDAVGADYVISGSFLAKSDNARRSLRELRASYKPT